MTRRKKDGNEPTLEVSRVVLDSGTAEVMFARGEIELTKRQIADLCTKPTVTLTPDQAPEFKPKARAQPIEWMTALDAVHWLSPHVGGDVQAKRAIAERLKDCALECSCVWLAEGLDVGDLPTRRPTVSNEMKPGTAYRLEPPTPQRSEIMLGGLMFKFSDNWERDLSRWEWSTGTIVTSNQRGAKVEIVDEEGNRKRSFAPGRMVAFGARFLREDIEKLVPPAAAKGLPHTPQSSTKSRGRTGPRPKKYYASGIRARLEAEIVSGELEKRLGDPNRWGVQAALEREISESFAPDNCPSESTIRRWVKKLMKAWRDFDRDR